MLFSIKKYLRKALKEASVIPLTAEQEGLVELQTELVIGQINNEYLADSLKSLNKDEFEPEEE